MSSFEWTPEHTKTLIALWGEGLTTSEIGRRLGITKNAVVGKVHRLGLKKRQSPIRGARTAVRRDKKREAAPAKAAAPVKKSANVKPESDEDTILEQAPAPKVKASAVALGAAAGLESLRSGMCCWPEGEPEDENFHFCGQPAVSEKPYCEEHCARAYVKVSRDRKNRNQATTQQANEAA